jgi:hypothetical protein
LQNTTTTGDKWTRKKYESRGKRERVEVKEEKDNPAMGRIYV